MSKQHNNHSKALLIGNGINRVTTAGHNVSWEDMLKHVASELHVTVDDTNKFKPFPLLLEEIVFKQGGDYHVNLAQTKRIIAEQLENIRPNNFHRSFISSGTKHILTTNYDYAFEEACQNFNINNDNEFPTLETKHSLYRRSYIRERDLSIWHIHGERQSKRWRKYHKHPESNSIMIGYDHYLEYLTKIQNYINRENAIPDKKNSLFIKPKNNILKDLSWINIYFTHTIIIAGLAYDFSEHHLWWLLNYRAKNRNKEQIRNTIKYYYTDLSENEPMKHNDKHNLQKIKKAKNDLFESLGVETIFLPCNNYEDYYHKVIQKEALYEH